MEGVANGVGKCLCEVTPVRQEIDNLNIFIFHRLQCLEVYVSPETMVGNQSIFKRSPKVSSFLNKLLRSLLKYIYLSTSTGSV